MKLFEIDANNTIDNITGNDIGTTFNTDNNKKNIDNIVYNSIDSIEDMEIFMGNMIDNGINGIDNNTYNKIHHKPKKGSVSGTKYTIDKSALQCIVYRLS